jgi:hypothetical protein
MKLKDNTLSIILLLFIVAENFFLFISHKIPFLGFGQTKNAVAYFASSLLIGGFLLYKFYKKQVVCNVYSFSGLRITDYKSLLLILIPVIWLAVVLNGLFLKFPVSAKMSDVIPTIEIAVKRLFAGENPYQVIQFETYSLPLTYLPMQWLPYSISEILHTDYRWITIIIFIFAILILCLRTLQGTEKVAKYAVPIALSLVLFFTYHTYREVFTMTVELMVASYYIFLVITLNKNNFIVTGIAISACLLSRYSLVLWLPLWAFTLFLSGNKKNLLVSVLTVIILISMIYIIPFLSKDWNYFYTGYKHYDISALGEWGHLNNESLPMHLYSGVGFAHLIYEKFSLLDLLDRIKILQKIHLVASLGIVIAMSIWYYFNRKKINHKIFLLASFKIYLAVFLAFIQVPYVYLMIVGNFVSIAIFAEQARYRITTT